MIVREPNSRDHHAEVDHDDTVAAPGRRFGGECADGWFAKSSCASIDEPAQPIGAEWRTGRPPPAAHRSSAFGENLMDPNDLVNRENAALDLMINSICRC
jgi:hypothetical protein